MVTKRGALAGVAILAVVVVSTGAWLHARSAGENAGARAAATADQLSAPVPGGRLTASSTYHWKECEQGDCYTAQRTFSPGASLTLKQADLALTAWAQRNGLSEAVGDDCVPADLLQPPGDTGCERTWRIPGHNSQLVSVWVHLAAHAVVKTSTATNQWGPYVQLPVQDFLVEVIDSDPPLGQDG